MAANLPGQSGAWCGQAIQVARCGSHSAGMRLGTLTAGLGRQIVGRGTSTSYDDPIRWHSRTEMDAGMGWTDFQPVRGLRNAHVQTVLGVVLRGSAFPHRTVRRLVTLPDGDRLVLYDTAPRGWGSPQPIALVLHGIGGSH